jgi:hypothetical protein
MFRLTWLQVCYQVAPHLDSILESLERYHLHCPKVKLVMACQHIQGKRGCMCAGRAVAALSNIACTTSQQGHCIMHAHQCSAARAFLAPRPAACLPGHADCAHAGYLAHAGVAASSTHAWLWLSCSCLSMCTLSPAGRVDHNSRVRGCSTQGWPPPDTRPAACT